jgi:O-antigen/teichoic acid export membrane protein
LAPLRNTRAKTGAAPFSSTFNPWGTLLQSFVSPAAWSFADQAIVSLGTFVVIVFLARLLTPAEYGVFALLLSVGFTAQLVNSSLSAYPLSVRIAAVRVDEYPRLWTSSILTVAVLCLPLSCFVAAAMFALGRADLVIPGVTWFFSYQILQATRRALLADMSHRKAILGDAISSLGQILIIGLVASMGSLSLPAALYSLAAASALGAITQASQLRLALKGFYSPMRWLSDNASLGTWSLAAVVVSTLRLYILFWLLAILAGPGTVASMQAGLNMFLPLNLVLFSLGNIIPQVAARGIEHGGRRGAWEATRPYILIALPPVILYVALMVLISPFALSTFYGSQSPYLQVGHLLPSLGLFIAAMIPCELLNCYFLGIKQTRIPLKINLMGAAAIAVLVPPFVALFGMLEGACVALAAGDVIRLMVAIRSLKQCRIEGR